MRELFRKLLQCTFIIIPGLGGLITLGYPECDGLIKYADDKYSYCFIYQKYAPDDSVEKFFENGYIIDLPGKVVDYHIYLRRPIILFEDGSVMEIYLSGFEGDRKFGEIKYLDKEKLLYDLENNFLSNQFSEIFESYDPSKWEALYSSYYRISNYRKKLLEEVRKENYDKLNFYIGCRGIFIKCYNVPVSSFENYIKSIGSLNYLKYK